MRNEASCLITAATLAVAAGTAAGQDYPTKTVRIATAPAGGGNDFWRAAPTPQ